MSVSGVTDGQGRVTKAVIPAAGLGTRFLPATKATPKEMLPVVDKPAIQYVVEEAAAAGLCDVLMVTGRSKRALEDHFDRAHELEQALAAKGDLTRLAQVRASSDLATVHYVRQGEALGLGHAVSCAEQHVGDHPFAVLLGDDLIDPRDPLLPDMVGVREQRGGSVLALMEVPREQIHLYGCVAVEPTDTPDVLRVTDLVEKPSADEAPSTYAVIGRYVLDPSIFAALRSTPPGKGGEIQLTDALRVVATQSPATGGGVHGVVFRGRRYDTGDRLDYLKAVVRLACEREDLGPELRSWLRDFVQGGRICVKSVDEHLAACLRGIDVLSPIDLQLLDAQGCVLAEEVVARTDLPVFDNSSMDGYAVHSVDVATASPANPVTLPVVGDVPAGSSAAQGLAPGTTVRIMTGAPLPAGADAVVQVELTDGGLAKVQIHGSVPAGRHVRRGGDDVLTGDVVLTSGTRLGPRQIGLLAAIGRDRVLARPKPRVVVLSTGSELVEPGASAAGGQIWDSNSFLITTAAREAGAVAFRIGIVPDEPKKLLDAIEDQLIRADLVVTTGGVSVGAYDVVKEVMSRLGTVEFDRISMQPGMPQGRGVIGPDRTPIFTLPGNPVSAYVSFEVFVRPVIRQLLGAKTIFRPEVRAAALSGFTSPAGKRQFARGALGVEEGRYVVQPLDGQGSHRVRDLAHANSLIVVPEDVTEVPEGGTVKVMVLERRLT